MNRTLFAICAALGVAASCPAQIFSLGTDDPKALPLHAGLTVSGVGDYNVAPSAVILRFGLETEGKTASKAADRCEQARRKLVAALRSLEGVELDVKPGGPRPRTNDDEAFVFALGAAPAPQETDSIQLIETVEVHARPTTGTSLMELTAKLVDLGCGTGATLGDTTSAIGWMESANPSPQAVEFVVGDSTSIRSQALAAALSNAKANVRDAAKLTGVAHGSLLHVDATPAGTMLDGAALTQPNPSQRSLSITARFATTAPQDANTPDGSDSQGVIVVGTATAPLRPDRVVVTLKLNATSEKATEALAALAQTRNALVQSLQALTDAAVEISPPQPSLGLDVNMEAVMMGGGQVNDPELRAQESVQVTVRAKGDTSLPRLVSAVIDAGCEHGATLAANSANEFELMFGTGTETSTGVDYRVSDTDQVREDALRAAVQDARQQAQAIAKISGVTLGPIRAIDLTQATLPSSFQVVSPPAPKLNVRIRFAIEPKPK